MSLCLFRVCFAAVVCATLVRTEVTVESEGYSNVLVSFAQNVPSNISKVLLENLENHLEKTSDFLREAVGRHISKVTFIIPKTWNTSEWNIAVESSGIPRDSKADIVVNGASDNVFGKLPSALQFGSCGTPGRQIVIPSNFLTEEAANFTLPDGAALAREWLKYRYGVFDENGYPEDELYPLYYSIPGGDPSKKVITDCSNKEITYNFITKDGNNCNVEEEKTQCQINPVVETLENVTSSLMYFHEKIPNMRHVCGKEPGHDHNTASPNKHNALCQRQSVWEVIKKSADFPNSTSSEPEEASEKEKIEFKYVHEADERVIIAWENTDKMKPAGETVYKAIRKFVYDLPKGSKVSLIPYTDANSMEKNYPLRQLDNWPADWTGDSISSTFSKPGDGCAICAITKALDILATDDSANSDDTIIIASSSTIDIDNTLSERLKTSKVCLVFLLFSDDIPPSEFEEHIKDIGCGTLVKISKTEEELPLFEKVFSAMEVRLPETIDDTATETVQTSHLGVGNITRFEISPAVQKVTLWMLGTKEEEAIEVTLNNEKVELTVEINTGDVLALSFSPNLEKKETAVMKNGFGNEPYILTQIRATTKPGQYFTGEVFIHDTTEKGSETQMPVILYASIRYGAYPVQDAEVRAKVTTPNGTYEEFLMYDNGRGDPDITANDGIYSRYFTKFTEKGEYTVSVEVKNNGDQTLGGKRDIEGHYPCCGSDLEQGFLELGEFTKTFVANFEAISGPLEGGYKPSRIVDLRIDSVADDKVVLTWTAPGGEADEGSATEYKMKLFCEDEENDTECDMHKMVRVLQCPLPMNYGVKQNITIQILNNSQILFIGIVTLNAKNLESDMSNLVQITGFSASILEITTIHPDSSKIEYQTSSVGTIVGSSIAGILILGCIIAAIYFFHKNKANNKRMKAHSENINTNVNEQRVKSLYEQTKHPVKMPPMRRVESFPVVLYTHDQIKDFKDKGRDPPLYKEDIPPKPWMSLNVLSTFKARENSEGETKSLGSSSTAWATGSSETNGTNKLNENP